MKYRWLTGLPILLLFVQSANSQDDPAIIKLRIASKEHDSAIRAKDPSGIASLYAPDAVCMPEFHPAAEGITSIRQYFTNWTKNIRSSTRTSQIKDLVKTKNAIIETGNFTDTIVKTSGDTLIYPGKYMRQWTISAKGELKIGSEIWGAVEYIDRSRFPYAGEPATKSVSRHVSRHNMLYIVKRNALIRQLVKERRGTEHAALFTNDAIYMPYYMPMMTGIEQVTSYFTDHEKPGDVIIDSLNIASGKMFSMDDMILEHGFYGVRWIANDKSSGVVTGKSLNLWKKNEKGEWMLHRQMVNHN